MKKIIPLLVLTLAVSFFSFGQNGTPGDQQRQAITSLIDQYSLARDKSDTSLLKTILTPGIDQLVSTGEWRNGIGDAMKGMMKSSASSPGTRTLQVDKIRMLNSKNAIVDCKYEIRETDNSVRRMWSTFIVVADKKHWKITAIRNMMPAPQ